MRAEYDYNPVLQNLQCLILGAHRFNVKNVKNLKKKLQK